MFHLLLTARMFAFYNNLGTFHNRLGEKQKKYSYNLKNCMLALSFCCFFFCLLTFKKDF